MIKMKLKPRTVFAIIVIVLVLIILGIWLSTREGFWWTPPILDYGVCNVNGIAGKCKDKWDCDGTAHVGYCPGPANIQCCLPEDAPDPSSNYGSCSVGGVDGQCINENTCTGQTHSGYCPGPKNIKCCTPYKTYGSCWANGEKGICKHTSQCDGTTTAGLCPGPKNIQCCTSSIGLEPPIVVDIDPPVIELDPITIIGKVPPKGAVVSLGDSMPSGQGGRWAGNSNVSRRTIDATGDATYQGGKCSRSKSAPIHIGTNDSVNFACSGAETSSDWEFMRFIPGIDFYNSYNKKGQCLQLQEYATNHDVELITITIGINNIGFSDFVTECAGDFLKPSFFKAKCKNDSKLKKQTSWSNMNTISNRIFAAYKNIVKAMENAGKSPDTYTIMVVTYPQIFPKWFENRYLEQGYDRARKGKCPFTDDDLDWMSDTVLPALNNAVTKAANKLKNVWSMGEKVRVKVLIMKEALYGRRLCERGVNLMEHTGLGTWKGNGAADKTEWVNQIRLNVLGNDYSLPEAAHPNYWGQLAQRNCVRMAYNDGDPVGGKCKRKSVLAGGLNARGEPNMRLTNLT
jgi:hypothetical protein